MDGVAEEMVPSPRPGPDAHSSFTSTCWSAIPSTMNLEAQQAWRRRCYSRLLRAIGTGEEASVECALKQGGRSEHTNNTSLKYRPFVFTVSSTAVDSGRPDGNWSLGLGKLRNEPMLTPTTLLAYSTLRLYGVDVSG